MKSDTPLDYAVFQLSPKRSRCELLVSRDGNIEKLASGLVKPFTTHLKTAEEQVAMAVQSIKLETKRCKNSELWFTKGTLERFVRFVSTPEVLELVNTFDAEMSQLEAARTIYSQGVEDQLSSTLGGVGSGTTAAADATKKELLRAIDVRLIAVKQDLTTACARAAAAGFNPGTISELQMFADQFGAYRLNEACSKSISLCERRLDVINSWKSGADERTVRSSYGLDMPMDDDPTNDQPSRPHQPHNISSTAQQKPSNNSSFVIAPSRCSREWSIEKDDDTSSARLKKEESGDSEAEPPATHPGPPARRLSVQDRISLFENKQKETPSGSGGRPVVAKSAVLRRWSGVSDMNISIDLSGENKSVDHSTPFDDLKEGLNETALSSDKSGLRSISGRVGDRGSKDSSVGEEVGTTKVGLQLTVSESDKAASTFETQAKTQSSSSFSQVAVNDQALSQSLSSERSEGSYGKHELGGIVNQVVSETQIARLKEGGGQIKPGAFAIKSGTVRSLNESYPPPEGEHSDRGEDIGSRNQSVSQTRLRAPLKTAVDSDSKIQEAFPVHYKGTDGVLLDSQSSWNSLKEIEEIEKQDLASSEKQSDSSIPKVEDCGIPGMNFQKQVSAREHIRKSQSRRNESSPVYGNNNTLFSGKMVTEGQEGFALTPVTPDEQVQRIRQSKGNQELNDELKMKANELEKLFAEHKLRAPGDQSNFTQRSRLSDMQIEQVSSLLDRKQVADITPQFPDNNTATDSCGGSSNVVKLNASSVAKLVDSQDYGDTLKCNISDLGFSDDSRGKQYDTYMQKRDAKLREEWGSRRAEKEAKLKAMKDNFELSRTEMRDKISGSADRQDTVSSARRQAERLRSFNTRSALKMEQSEDDEDSFDLPEEKPLAQDRSFGDTSIGNGVSRSSQTKRILPNRNLSSFMTRTLAAPVPRSAIKASNSSSVRQSENPLVQSVPNFSDLRKENTKPYSAVSKVACPQLRNYTHSSTTTTSEEMPNVKEEKARRSQSLRKSTASPAEFKDMSRLDSKDVLTPLKFDVEQTQESRYDKFSRSMESKSLLQKNISIRCVAGDSDAKLKASMVSKSLNNDEEYDDLAFDPDDSAGMVKDEDDEGFLTRIDEARVNMDHREPSFSQESAKLINSGSENGDALQSFSQLEPSPFLSSMPSTFHSVVGLVQDSPGESPMTWNSRIHHPFSYPHEVSDIDASADSPMGSPVSWNLHALNQTEADAARMRKKWGSAQKPIIGTNSSNNQSRKDVTKGFKRLLKFGRKSRGTESLVDWISATTSEGDDDMEDGRDPANRSSEDLRKSRMGFLQCRASEDSFNESELFAEQVDASNSSIPAPPANFKLREDHLLESSIKAPRSFFSLSSFRSKGSESKLR